MKKFNKFFSVFLTVLMVISALPLSASADGVTLTVESDKNVINAGDTVTVNVVLSQNSYLNCLTIDMVYDNSKLEYVSGTENGFFMSEILNSSYASNKLRFAAVDIEAVTDGGAVLTVVFKALSSSCSTVYVDIIESTDDKMNTIPVTAYTLELHSAGEWEITKEATCIDVGVKAKKCECGCNTYGTEGIPVKEHSYDEGTVYKLPACSKPGYKKYVCTVCGDSYKVEIPAINHTNEDGTSALVEIPAVAPTCTSVGYTAGEKCTLCNSITIAPEKLPIIDHSWEKGAVKEPTCTEEGYTTYVCTVCGKSDTSEVIPKTRHNYVNGVCATCGEVNTNKCGDNAYWDFHEPTGTLTISGTGDMSDYQWSEKPWEIYRYTIKSVVIENGVTSIGDDAFDNCHNLTSVTIPDSVTSIGDCAFVGCKSLTSITIGKSVSIIGEDAIFKCYSLTSITVDNDNQYYSSDEYGVLFNKDKTTLIQYPIGNTRTSYTIPDSVTEIGDNAFFSCYSLKSVAFGDSVKTIGNYSFAYCNSLTSITIPDSVISISDFAFCSCDSLISVTIPDSVTKIGYGAFSSCDSLTSIIIPDSVTTIGKMAFDSCDSLTSIKVDSNNKYYSSDEYGVLFSKDKTTLIQYPIGNTRKNYTIPDGVTTIGDSAFEFCTSLTSITIPDGVTSIGAYAFAACTSLKSIIIPDGVKKIDCKTFASCKSLISVTIPVSVIKITMGGFAYCTSITDVFYSGTEEQWKEITIEEDNDPLLNAKIHFNYDIPDYVVGDVNNDGKINQLDRVVLTRYIADWEGYTENTINIKAADVNGDGKVNQLDRTILTRHIANWEGYEVLPYVK